MAPATEARDSFSRYFRRKITQIDAASSEPHRPRPTKHGIKVFCAGGTLSLPKKTLVRQVRVQEVSKANLTFP